jgi:hypothetical protein
LHSSETRKCLVNGRALKYVESGDLALLFNGKIYLKGRDSRVVKINGKQVNLNLLDEVNA